MRHSEKISLTDKLAACDGTVSPVVMKQARNNIERHLLQQGATAIEQNRVIGSALVEVIAQTTLTNGRLTECEGKVEEHDRTLIAWKESTAKWRKMIVLGISLIGPVACAIVSKLIEHWIK